MQRLILLQPVFVTDNHSLGIQQSLQQSFWGVYLPSSYLKTNLIGKDDSSPAPPLVSPAVCPSHSFIMVRETIDRLRFFL